MIDIEAGRDSYDNISGDAEPDGVHLFSAMTLHSATDNSTVDRRHRRYIVQSCSHHVRCGQLLHPPS